jgi:ABC-2 type transport system ATP-binding protein
MSTAASIATHGLGKRYRDLWTLRDCTFSLPAGRVAALVGANGTGKTTLLNLIMGVVGPTEGQVLIAGTPPLTPSHDAGRASFVPQHKPLYRTFTAAEMLRVGRDLNQVWDQGRALTWLRRFEVPLDRACGTLSGGQQAQVSLAIALGSCPSLLLLDEPLATLDPLARTEVTGELLAQATDTGMTVLLSTHVLAELVDVADYLLLLSGGSLLLHGDTEDLLTEHHRITGPTAEAPPGPGEVVWASHTERQSTFLIRTTPADRLDTPSVCAGSTVEPVGLEELVLGYLRAARGSEKAA